MTLKFNDVISYKIEGKDLIVLKEFKNNSELLRMSFDSTIVWRCNIPKSYDFFILKQFIYVTTKDSTKTLVLNKHNGDLCDQLEDTVIHAPILYSDDSFVTSFISHLSSDIYGLLDNNLKLISKLNPNSLKVTKVVNNDSFISFNKGILTLVDFLSSNDIWSLSLLQEVENMSNGENTKLRFLDSQMLDNVMVISVFNTRSNNQYLFGLDMNTGKVMWYKESVLNFVAIENCLMSLRREGELDIFDIETGLLLRTKSLSKSFQDLSINCNRGLKIEGDLLLFKDEDEKKLGAIELRNLDLKFVHNYPKEVNLSPNEYPRVIGERMILHDQLAKELHLVGIELHQKV